MKTKNGISLILLMVMGLILILTNSCKKSDDNKNPSTSITDKDGNVYTSVTIGTQVWMVENLKTTKLNDGTAIPNVTDNTAWTSLTTPGYCWYNNDVANKTPYGALYNWYTVNAGKLCPTGWHVPTDAEWTTLITFLGGEDVAGGKLKETGTTHWESPNNVATNESGFKGLPGGFYADNGFWQINAFGLYWLATGSVSWGADYIALDYIDITTGINATNKIYYGYSVRCLKDN
jgi:uncharacterized protein (TIGR02145 family)